ncbi:MAG: LuxR C-terminal-related transcriptional regulator [Acidobacteria bacterium]|nr:LuxR C-terminal-related transcriptional regulator [Acidobacteriota bacterium]
MAPTILLESKCPPPDDPEFQRFLMLLAELADARWLRLEIRRKGRPQCYRYTHGQPAGEGREVTFSSPGHLEATLTLDSDARQTPAFADAARFMLDRLLWMRRLRHQAALLRGALDTTTSAVLLFDREGNIAYANPPADQLLSRQTESELTAREHGAPARPLLAVLCSWVDELLQRQNGLHVQRCTLTLSDGSVLACELLRLRDEAREDPGFVALLQPVAPATEPHLAAVASTYQLSPREREVLTLLAAGLATPAIAEKMGISPHTVRDHLKNLFRKTGTSSRSKLMSLLRQPATPVGPF